MSLCINPLCSNPQNRDNILFCLACGSELLLEGRYRVMNQLGGGGFGKTYEVSETQSNTPKVLKVLINNHPKAVELFQREAEVLAQLNHPGIPKVESDGYFVYFPRNNQQPLHCLIMEKIEGLDLCEYIKQKGDRPITQKLAVQWLNEIITILQQVHRQNFFHRDIKPANIMLRADGRLALIDFGTAREVTETYLLAQAQGQVTGIVSAGYTPPEQINGQAVQQSDFFALGRTFIYLLTAKDPRVFYHAPTDELRWRDAALEISPQFADFLDSLMARLPSQRPPNTEVILQQLAQINQMYSSGLTNSPTRQEVTTTQPTKPKQIIGMSFWWQWLVATGIGGAIGTGLGYVVNRVVGGVLGNALNGVAVWATVGIAQSFVLRKLGYQVVWWVLADAIGGAVGNVLRSTVLCVAIAGSLQSSVLRRLGYKAFWWILATVVAGAMRIPVSIAVANLGFSILGSSVSFCVFGAITGAVLVWLLRE